MGRGPRLTTLRSLWVGNPQRNILQPPTHRPHVINRRHLLYISYHIHVLLRRHRQLVQQPVHLRLRNQKLIPRRLHFIPKNLEAPFKGE